MGHRFSLLFQSRRLVAGGVVRAHRIHRYINLDRSNDADLHHPADEFGASAREGKCDWLARESCDGSCGVVELNGQRTRGAAVEEYHRLQRGLQRCAADERAQWQREKWDRRAAGAWV